MANKSPRSHHVPIRGEAKRRCEMRRDRPLAKVYDGLVLGLVSFDVRRPPIGDVSVTSHQPFHSLATTLQDQLQRSVVSRERSNRLSIDD